MSLRLASEARLAQSGNRVERSAGNLPTRRGETVSTRFNLLASPPLIPKHA